MEDSGELQTGRDRLTRIFRFLEDFNQLRNPAKRLIREQPWVLWLRDLPEHPTVRRGAPPKDSAGVDLANEIGTAAGDDFVLKVRRPALSDAPSPPPEITEWLETDWRSPDSEIRTAPEREEISDDGTPFSVRFEDDPLRAELLNQWLRHREAWAARERPARAAFRIFERLYELRGQMEREAERVELVLGDGMLVWKRPEGAVHHPALLQRLQIEFDPDIPEFTLTDSDHPAELYTSLFQAMPEVDGKAIGSSMEELEQDQPHPLGADSTSGFLRRLVQRLSVHGEFTGDGEPHPASEHPRIGREPVIFMRTRTLGFAAAIQSILEDVRTQERLPPSLLRIAGVQPPPVDGNGAGASKTVPLEDEDEDILLSKPSNREQVQITRRLDRHGCVLVQGPPGTGKTHTIGNLIGHLLAQGKSILVTSHTAKALQVLRDQVADSLRPLCVSVLVSDSASREQLESSVDGILHRRSTDSPERLDADAERLTKQRHELLARLRQARERRLNARSDEYREVVVGGHGYAPSDAARTVAAGKGEDDWIPGPVTLGASLPLSPQEVVDLYFSNAAVTREDENEIDTRLPNPADLLSPDRFAAVVDERRRLAGEDLLVRADLWQETPCVSALRCAQCGADNLRHRDRGSRDSRSHCARCSAALSVAPANLPTAPAVSPEALEALSEHLMRAARQLRDDHAWSICVVADGYRGGQYREPWIALMSLIESVTDQAASAAETLLRCRPSVSGDALPEQARILAEIVQHLDSGKRLDWIAFLAHARWKRLSEKSRVAAGRPRTVEDFRALLVAVRLRMSREELAARWDLQVGSMGGPAAGEFGAQPELACAQYTALIRTSMEWYPQVWAPLEDLMGWYGFRWDRFLDETPPNPVPNGEVLRLRDTVLHRLSLVLTARANRLRWARVENRLADLLELVTPSSAAAGCAEAVGRLREAVTQLDPTAYRQAFTRLAELHSRSVVLARRRDLLRRMAVAAPGWAAAVWDRVSPHDGGAAPGDPMAAWLWRQLNDELDARSRTPLDPIQQEIQQAKDDLQRVTAELVDRLAWAGRLDSYEKQLSQQQALEGWRGTVEKMGKGAGRRVPRLMAQARNLMKECQAAVPVWVMPLARVVENFRPQAGLFDVVIIDEASQSDVMGLIALYMGKQVVIVGDHEQVSPDAVGQRLDEVQQLIDTHLEGIPNAELYDGQMSIYDLARTSFGGLICLREHFRCVPDIIQFSNHLSYEGKILPLRDPSRVDLRPHVIAHRVQGAVSRSQVNEKEAMAVASLVAAAIEQPEYEGKTFGVVSLVGEGQALRIDQLLRAYLPTADYERRKGGPAKAFCGNPAQFQGDERDVMFLSVVDGPQEGPLPERSAGPRDMFKKRFNVAASRARDQMWVVHSLNPAVDLKPGDLRRRLIEHAQDPAALRQVLEGIEARTESELERQVCRHLVLRGYRVIPQWKVGSYRIDLVIEDRGKQLAVECDGDRYHRLDNLAEDMERQAILERVGWTFSRIRGSEFFRDPSGTMDRLYARLEELEMEPQPLAATGGADRPQESELRDRIARRAEELRRLWLEKWALEERALDGEEAASRPEALNRTERAAADPEMRIAETAEAIGARSHPGTDVAVARTTPRCPPEQETLFAEEDDSALHRVDRLADAILQHLRLDVLQCTACAGQLKLWIGRWGPFLRCTRAACGKTQAVESDVLSPALDDLALTCGECGAPAKLARSRYGYFVGCSRYPECKTPVPWKNLRTALLG